MKANSGNAGSWPVPQLPPPAPEAPPKKNVFYAKQNWESVVKKGNSEFSDDMVQTAVAKKKEPIMIGGEPVKPAA